MEFKNINLKKAILMVGIIVTVKSQAGIQCRTSTQILIPTEVKYECTRALENQANSWQELDEQMKEIAISEFSNQETNQETTNQDTTNQSEFKEHYDLAWYRCGHVGEKVKYEVSPDLKFSVNIFSYYDETLFLGMTISSDNKLISQKIQPKSFPNIKVKINIKKNKWDYISCSATK